MEKQSGHSVLTLRADKEGELTSHQFNHYCELHGIQREFASTDTPSKNGVVERKNRTVIEMAQTMLEHQNLPQNLWAEAMLLLFIFIIGPLVLLF